MRLTGKFCDAQGTNEPIVCPKGHYCPTPKEKHKCPSGHFCITGSTAPMPCPAVSNCPEGSHRVLYLGGLVACIVLDAIVFGLWLFFKRFYKRGDIKFIKMKRRFRKVAMQSPVEPHHPVTIDVDRKKTVAPDGLVAGFEKARNNMALPMSFEFTDLSITLPTGKNILNGVSGAIKPARLTAIMGPSGAGKTTFMNCLMGKVKRTGGSLRIDDKDMEVHHLKQVIGYVPQDDVMISELTVRENIRHSAAIRLPSSWKSDDVNNFTDSILEALDLTHVADNIVGDAMSRGVSGGQKKRTNIAIELAAAPLAIFLDEPTSGLDATAALKVANILRDIRELGLTIVAVIHQPRQEIFDSFDDLLMIAPGGNTAYLGPRNQVVDFYRQQGFVFDTYKNQADELMDILSGKGIKQDQSSYSVSDLVRHWNENKGQVEQLESEKQKYSPEVMEEILAVSKQRGGNVFWQALLCHNRSIVQQYRLIGALGLEIVVALLAGGIMGAAAMGGSEKFQGVLVHPFTLISAAPLAWFVPMITMLMGMAVGLAGSPAGVKAFGEERLVFFREAAAGHNRVAYYFGKMFSMFYREILAALHFSTIYHILSQPLISFNLFFGVIFLFWFCVYGLAACVSMIVKRENASLLAVVICMFAGVFNGFGPSLKMARDWRMIWFWDISYGRWLSEAMYTEEVYPFHKVYDLPVTTNSFGYAVNEFTLNCIYGFLIGCALHIGGLLFMLFTKRQRQR